MLQTFSADYTSIEVACYAIRIMRDLCLCGGGSYRVCVL